MTAVFRAYSPTRDDYHGLTDDEHTMRGIVGTLNQGAVMGIRPADWAVQAGHVQWETP